MKKFPTLYEKSSTGKIKVWGIQVIEIDPGIGRIVTQHGAMGGNLQETFDDVVNGKNQGKKNETTAWEQAVLEAEAKWTKKLKSGYVQTLEDAQAGNTDKIITGGIEPMLAHDYTDHKGKISFPCAGQPKLDGIRCIAIKSGTNVSLFSRTRKPIKSCPHIIRGILEVFNGVESLVLDGELYNHEYKDNFESIVSAVRKDSPSEGSAKVEYHIYDTVREGHFSRRMAELFNDINGHHDAIKIVPTIELSGENDISLHHTRFVEAGYEGLMVRNRKSPYENKRSYHLQKFKEFKDAEFEVIGVEEGRGKLAGLVGAFVLKDGQGREFKAKPTGDQEATAAFIKNPSLAIGRMATIKYQGLTGKNGVPRFPIFIRFREVGL